MSNTPLTAARHAVVQSPSDISGLRALVLAHYPRAEFSLAQTAARRALAAAPQDDAALYLLALALAGAGRLEEAAHSFLELADRKSAYGRFEQLQFLCMMGQSERCRGLLDELAQRPDLKPNQCLLLSRVAYAIDDRLVPLATRLLRKAIALEPAAVGRLGKIGSYRYGRCSEVGSDFGSRPETFPFCCRIDRAAVMPDGSVLTDDGTLILEDIVPAPRTLVIGGSRVLGSSPLQESVNLGEDPIARVLLNLPHRERRIPGTALLFGGNQNFSHLVNDFLSKFAVLGQEGPWDRVILSATCHSAAEDFLAALGVAPGTIIRQERDERLRPDRLLVPSVGHRYPDLPVDHIAWLREKFRRPVPALGRRSRLFISRAGSRGRNVQNADALRGVLDEFGIEEIRLELLPLGEQLDRLAACELIIGATGGGSATYYFVPDDCAIVELYFAGAGVLSQQPGRLLSQLGNRYRSIECERAPFGPSADSDGDMTIPLDRLKDAITASLSMR